MLRRRRRRHADARRLRGSGGAPRVRAAADERRAGVPRRARVGGRPRAGGRRPGAARAARVQRGLQPADGRRPPREPAGASLLRVLEPAATRPKGAVRRGAETIGPKPRRAALGGRRLLDLSSATRSNAAAPSCSRSTTTRARAASSPRYYRRLGFATLREVGDEGGMRDFADQVVWGGVGTLMEVDVRDFVARWGGAVREMAPAADE